MINTTRRLTVARPTPGADPTHANRDDNKRCSRLESRAEPSRCLTPADSQLLVAIIKSNV